MLCHTCRRAGEVLKLDPSEEHPDPESETVALHQSCEDPNCTCQHRIDKNVINQERISPSNDT